MANQELKKIIVDGEEYILGDSDHYTKSETDSLIYNAIGDIETALDEIITIQEALIGGETE